MIDDYDDVTEDDVASGFFAFRAGYYAGFLGSEAYWRDDVITLFEQADDSVKMMLRGCLEFLGMEWMTERSKQTIEDIESNQAEHCFESWRLVHPLDKTSAKYEGQWPKLTAKGS